MAALPTHHKDSVCVPARNCLMPGPAGVAAREIRVTAARGVTAVRGAVRVARVRATRVKNNTESTTALRRIHQARTTPCRISNTVCRAINIYQFISH